MIDTWVLEIRKFAIKRAVTPPWLRGGLWNGDCSCWILIDHLHEVTGGAEE